MLKERIVGLAEGGYGDCLLKKRSKANPRFRNIFERSIGNYFLYSKMKPSEQKDYDNKQFFARIRSNMRGGGLSESPLGPFTFIGDVRDLLKKCELNNDAINHILDCVFGNDPLTREKWDKRGIKRVTSAAV